MTNSRKVYVVIPNWNGANMIEACLSSLSKQSIEHEVIVVDNGSTDQSVNIIKKLFPKVTVLEFPNNAGFSGGVNRGIKYAMTKEADYIALLNNDAVADEVWLAQLLKEIEAHPKAGIVTGKLLMTDEKHIDSTGEELSVWGLPFPRGRNQLDEGQYEEVEEIFGASGGASLYRAELFKQVGLFDEDYFAYYEDVDMSFRAQLTGWRVYYTPKAKAYHSIGGTSSKMGDFARYQSAKNFLLLYARNMPPKLYWKYLALFKIQFLRMALSSIVRRKFGVFLRGTWGAIKLLKSTKKVRRVNLSKQSVSTDYIDSILTHARPPRIPKL